MSHHKRTLEEEEDEIVKELCTTNGINLSRLLEDGMATMQLETFFSGYPRMVGLRHFPNLLSLVIVGQTVDRMENLKSVPQLRELWIVECKLQKIECLQHVTHLQKLYLYSNEISRIENLEYLSELEVLWLHGNKIKDIEGLENLKQLKELNLAENRIEKIGNSLSALANLESLELSGNKIWSFSDLTNLTKLTRLVELGLKSPMYSPAPVGELCNYQTHILYHLPNLNRLDTYDVTTRQLKENSEGAKPPKGVKELAKMTVMKKKMYYNMKVKTLRRNLSDLLSHLNGAYTHLISIPRERLRQLLIALSTLERELNIVENKEDNSNKEEREDLPEYDKPAIDPKRHSALSNKMKAVKERIKKWEMKVAEIEYFWKASCEKMRHITDVSISRAVTELETGGNVRFEDGKPTDIWFTSCHDLLLSRFCAADYRDHGIIGVKIHRITRIHNRILRSKFDNSLSAKIDDEDIYNPGASAQRMATCKKYLEYLFFVWDPSLPGGIAELMRIPHEGFWDGETYKKLGREPAVPLANSLSLADKFRMAHAAKQAKGKSYEDICPFRHGKVLVAKVYVGKSVAQNSSKLTIDNSIETKYDTIYRPRKDIKDHPDTDLEGEDKDTQDNESSDKEKSDFASGDEEKHKGVSSLDDKSHPEEVDKEYDNSSEENNESVASEEEKPVENDTDSDAGSYDEKEHVSEDSEKSSQEDEDIKGNDGTIDGQIPPPSRTTADCLNLSGLTAVKPCECKNRQSEWFALNNDLVMPEYCIDFEYVTRIKPKSPFAAYAESLQGSKSMAVMPALDNITSDEDILNMDFDIEPRLFIDSLTEDVLLESAKASSLANIRVLDLHSTGLTRLKNIHLMPNLKRLTISFNEITKLEDIAQMDIEYLDARFNKLTTLDGIRGMQKLTHLDVRWNHLHNTREDISTLRKHAPALLNLDLRHNNWQKPGDLKLRVIGRIKTLTVVDGTPVTDDEATAALRLAAGSRISQVSILGHSRTDFTPPRTLQLAGYAHILTQCSRNYPDRLGEHDTNWFSKVTTLNLDGQHITKLSNLDKLENLRWASFSDNDITKIEGLDNCQQIEELSLENNCLTKIEGLSRLIRLKKLSIGHNFITTLEDSGLDRLGNLVYLSMENNQIPSLLGLQRAVSLVELYIGNNSISNIREVFYLKQLPSLVILDLCGNQVATSVESYRLFVIFHLKALKALDGAAIELHEATHAKDAFGGRLTSDFVAERLGHGNFNEIKELDFPHCSIRTVDLGSGEMFLNLRSVNLEHNNLTSFSGLIFLVNLRVLCLNHNHIDCIIPKPKQLPANLRRGLAERTTGLSGVDPYNPDSYTPILENLEVLHLGYNNIKDLAALQLSRLTSLKALFLQGNEIIKVEGIEGLQDLRELVLDRNKIKAISEYSFCNQWNLQELHIEENRLRDLSHLACLENLQRLFLGMNRIQDMSELERLENMTSLMELSLVSNAVARRLLHRPMLVYRMPQLSIIDGIPVSDEERAKAELYFMEQQPQQTTVDTTLPGIGQYKTQIPVKVTNMQLLSGPFVDKTYGGTLQLSDDIYQQEIQRAFLNLPQGGTRRRAPERNNHRDPMATTGGVGGGGRFSNVPYQHGANNGASNQGSRSQHQVPYVPYQGSNSDQYADSISRLNKAHRR